MGYGVTWDTELHETRSYMGYGATWDTELHGIWIQWMFCLGGYLYKDLKVSRSYVFLSLSNIIIISCLHYSHKSR